MTTFEEAAKTVSEDRMDVYGKPEDSFERIARYWNVYLKNKGCNLFLSEGDVALMMALFKIAREQGNGHKHDNIVDACGYLGIYNDRIMERGKDGR